MASDSLWRMPRVLTLALAALVCATVTTTATAGMPDAVDMERRAVIMHLKVLPDRLSRLFPAAQRGAIKRIDLREPKPMGLVVLNRALAEWTANVYLPMVMKAVDDPLVGGPLPTLPHIVDSQTAADVNRLLTERADEISAKIRHGEGPRIERLAAVAGLMKDAAGLARATLPRTGGEWQDVDPSVLMVQEATMNMVRFRNVVKLGLVIGVDPSKAALSVSKLLLSFQRE